MNARTTLPRVTATSPRKGKHMSHRINLRTAACLSALVLGLGWVHGARADETYVTGIAPQSFAPVVVDADKNEAATAAALTAQTAALVAALQALSGQNVVNARSATQASSQMMDTMDARETQRRIVDTKVRAAIASAPSATVCNVITGNVSASNSFGAVGQWRRELNMQQIDFFMGASTGTAASKGVEAATEQRNQVHCAVGATPADVRTGLCQTAVPQAEQTESGKVLTPPYGRDLDADTLIAPVTLTLSQQDQQAANAFLLNAFGDAPVAAQPPGAATNAAGRAKASQNMAAAAQHSIALDVVDAILADRAAMPGTGGTGGQTQVPSGSSGVTATLASWAEGTANNTTGYVVPQGASQFFPNGVSRVAYMKLRAMSWFWNANWVSSIGSAGADQVMKEVAMIQAFQTVQNWELYQQVERMNLTLAAMESMMEARNRQGSHQ
jgi:hypothetical protein